MLLRRRRRHSREVHGREKNRDKGWRRNKWKLRPSWESALGTFEFKAVLEKFCCHHRKSGTNLWGPGYVYAAAFLPQSSTLPDQSQQIEIETFKYCLILHDIALYLWDVLNMFWQMLSMHIQMLSLINRSWLRWLLTDGWMRLSSAAGGPRRAHLVAHLPAIKSTRGYGQDAMRPNEIQSDPKKLGYCFLAK